MNIVLFITTALIWGSTWLAIKLQLGQVLPLWSLVYRFAIAAVILITYCTIARIPLSFNRQQHGWIAIQALFTYFLNYMLFYFATGYFASGIVATLFAVIMIANIINGRIFLGNPIELKTVLGAFIGLMGLVCIIWSEVVRLEDKDMWYIIEGVALGIGGAISASLGQMTVVFNTRRGLPMVQTNALGYAYGSLFTLIVALTLGQAPGFDLSWTYVSSLLYLASVGTVVAFLCYLTLITRIGPEKSAYAFVLIPIIAMGLSVFYENMTWTSQAIFGSGLVLLGNVIVMAKKDFHWKFWKPQASPLGSP